MKKYLLPLLLAWGTAQAGTPPQPHDMSGGWVVTTCGADALTAGAQGVLELTPDGKLCVSGNVTATGSAAITNPSSVNTRPANATAYAQNNLIANSVTAGSVVAPSVAIANAAGGAAIPRVRLVTNKATGWDAVAVRVRLWTAAPTYTGGDGAAYAPATGAAGLVGVFDVTLTQFGDGASGNGAPAVGTSAWVKLASGTAVYWDMQYTGSASLTPASGQTFTLTAELVN